MEKKFLITTDAEISAIDLLNIILDNETLDNDFKFKTGFLSVEDVNDE